MKFRVLMLGSLLLLNSILTFAGNGDGGSMGGNGGGVWVCQNKDSLGTLRKVVLVDFYEAEKEFNLLINAYTGLKAKKILELYKYRIFEIDKSLAVAMEPYFSRLAEKLNPVDTDLEVIDDALFRVRPPQRWCEGGTISYQQLANYTNYKSILINEYLFNHVLLSEIERAGLMLHEVVYEYLRDKFQDKDSQRTRRFVGVIASTLSIMQAKDVIEFEGVIMNPLKMTFTKISKGTFVMGGPGKEPGGIVINGGLSLPSDRNNQVNVTISKDFLIMKTEVTQYQWFKIMGANPANFKNYVDCEDTHIVVDLVEMCPNNPVEQVSWNDVQIFIAKLNGNEGRFAYRLPTEAEWEYAARAGTNTRHSFGAADINKYAWYLFNSGLRTHAVATKLPNPYGLFDMHGNVTEWVQDTYSDDDILPGGVDPVVNIAGEYKMYRGGSYSVNERACTSDDRFYEKATARYNTDLGFRLVKNL